MSGLEEETGFLLFTLHISIRSVLLFFYNELTLLNKVTQTYEDRKASFFALLTILVSSLVYWFPHFPYWSGILQLHFFFLDIFIYSREPT